MKNEAKDGISRRDFLVSVGAAGGAAAAPRTLLGASEVSEAPQEEAAAEAEKEGLLGAMRPQQNQFRNLMDLSGFWQFQLDPKGEG